MSEHSGYIYNYSAHAPLLSRCMLYMYDYMRWPTTYPSAHPLRHACPLIETPQERRLRGLDHSITLFHRRYSCILTYWHEPNMPQILPSWYRVHWLGFSLHVWGCKNRQTLSVKDSLQIPIAENQSLCVSLISTINQTTVETNLLRSVTNNTFITW